MELNIFRVGRLKIVTLSQTVGHIKISLSMFDTWKYKTRISSQNLDDFQASLDFAAFAILPPSWPLSCISALTTSSSARPPSLSVRLLSRQSTHDDSCSGHGSTKSTNYVPIPPEPPGFVHLANMNNAFTVKTKMWNVVKSWVVRFIWKINVSFKTSLERKIENKVMCFWPVLPNVQTNSSRSCLLSEWFYIGKNLSFSCEIAVNLITKWVVY